VIKLALTTEKRVPTDAGSFGRHVVVSTSADELADFVLQCRRQHGPAPATPATLLFRRRHAH
jgi:hypothetical protein